MLSHFVTKISMQWKLPHSAWHNLRRIISNAIYRTKTTNDHAEVCVSETHVYLKTFKLQNTATKKPHFRCCTTAIRTHWLLRYMWLRHSAQHSHERSAVTEYVQIKANFNFASKGTVARKITELKKRRQDPSLAIQYSFNVFLEEGSWQVQLAYYDIPSFLFAFPSQNEWLNCNTG